MSNASQALAAGIAFHQAGRLKEAEAAYQCVLQMEPDHAQAWYLLGGLAYQSGNRDLASQWLGRAAQLAPQSTDYLFGWGQILEEQGKLDAAADCYRRAIHLQSQVPQFHDSLGLVLQKLGDAPGAIVCHRKALELCPTSAEAHFNIGTAQSTLEQFDKAIASYRRAIELKPDYAEAYCNKGNALRSQAKLVAAIECHHRALMLNPHFLEAHINLGNALADSGSLEQAIASYRRALQLWPDCPEALNGLGVAFRAQGLLDEAADCFRRACQLKPEWAEPQCNLGTTLRDQARLLEAVDFLRRALDLKPFFPRAHSNLVYSLYFCPGFDAAAIYAEHARWNDQHARPLYQAARSYSNNRSSTRRLRIGYVSPDFRHHVQSHFHAPLLAAHDHRQFEIFCYSDVVTPDAMTERLRALTDGWRDIKGMSDEQVAALVRQDGIDILIDLTMHMERNRLLVFARKPAPVQVTWLAYPGTTGLTAIDYRLTDPWLDPPDTLPSIAEQKVRHYSEASLQLPDTFWCYDPLANEPAVNDLPAIAKGFVTFGNLNVFCKVNTGILQLWAGVLREVEGSHLLLLAPQGSCRNWVSKVFQDEGIEPGRIEFFGRQPRAQYLQAYHRIDIGLDSVPYNGHTTSLDSLWMGVPVVTIVGDTVVGRAGLSQLNNLGLTDLIAQNDDEFVRIATGLAKDANRLSALRTTLRGRMERSPLMDGPRFTRNVEIAYRTIWQRWCDEAAGRVKTTRLNYPPLLD